jgi:hypothetical protein
MLGRGSSFPWMLVMDKNVVGNPYDELNRLFLQYFNIAIFYYLIIIFNFIIYYKTNILYGDMQLQF